MSWWDKIANVGNNLNQYIGKKLSPPPEQDQFQINGELSPDEFKRAGKKLTEVCEGWQWRKSLSAYSSKYLDEDKQYLVLEKVLCKKRLTTLNLSAEEINDKEEIGEGEEIVILKAPDVKEEEEKEENFRSYTMYIVYDEYYHTPRMYFSATSFNGEPISSEGIKQDIQKEYLDKTLTVEPFPFLENVSMPTVHPCKHAAVLKTMSDSMVEGGNKVESHFALLIFLKFITSVIPTVEFDLTGDLLFK